MTSAPSSPDLPFPGAHSQVTGRPRDDSPPPPGRASAGSLPLEISTPRRDQAGWAVRLPVRAEQVEIEKRVVVYERVHIERREDHDVTRETAEIHREELRVRDTRQP